MLLATPITPDKPLATKLDGTPCLRFGLPILSGSIPSRLLTLDT